MSDLVLAAVIGIALLVGLFVALMIRSELKARHARSQISRSLGFAPVASVPELASKISQVYWSIRATRAGVDRAKYELQNVFAKRLPDCEMFIFDLVDVSGGESSATEKQVVAVVSPQLNLPVFMLFPNVEGEGPLADLASQLLDWVIAQFGNPVEFPQVPEFGQHYLVSSPDPDGTRQFLDDSRLRRLARMRLVGVHAGGDIFTLSRLGVAAQPLTAELMTERVNQAMSVYSVFLS